MAEEQDLQAGVDGGEVCGQGGDDVGGRARGEEGGTGNSCGDVEHKGVRFSSIL